MIAVVLLLILANHAEATQCYTNNGPQFPEALGCDCADQKFAAEREGRSEGEANLVMCNCFEEKKNECLYSLSDHCPSYVSLYIGYQVDVTCLGQERSMCAETECATESSDCGWSEDSGDGPPAFAGDSICFSYGDDADSDKLHVSATIKSRSIPEVDALVSCMRTKCPREALYMFGPVSSSGMDIALVAGAAAGGLIVVLAAAWIIVSRRRRNASVSAV